jgi:tetratricopeptide (TPR) repeat protein
MAISTETPQHIFTKGSALLQAFNAAEALGCFQRILSSHPNDPTVNLFAGTALHDLGRYDEAVACYRIALSHAPQMGEAHNNLGNSLLALGQFTEAAECFSRAAALLPNSPVPLAARASALQALGNVTEAEMECRRALLRDPAFPAAHWNLALNLLLQGRYEEGWQEYEWRWQKPDFTSPRRHSDVPLWDGSPLNGQTILLHAEQGFGDAIQFVRYAPLVAEQGGSVVLECHPELVSLFRGLPEVTMVVPFGTPLPHFSFQAPLLSLPRILKTSLRTIPNAIPYLTVPIEKKHKWSSQMAVYPSSLRVGLVWAGSKIHGQDRLRSLPLKLLEVFAGLDGVTFFSLQMGESKRQLALSSLSDHVIDLCNTIEDFADTAACIEQLDLLISVDTAVAHLAGSLGTPVWLLLHFTPDWRWLLDREDSPWYPGMRIFRQNLPGEWGDVAERIKSALDIEITSRKKSLE